MNFNVDRIAQLAGLAGSAKTSLNEGAGRGVLNESSNRRAQPTTYDRVVEELQTRGLEMFYSPEQIQEAIRHESRLLREEKEMENEGKCPSCGKSPCRCDETLGEMDMGYDDESGMSMDEIMAAAAKSAEDEGMYPEDEGMHAEYEGYAVGTKITEPDGTQTTVTKAGSGKPGSLAEAKLTRLLKREVDAVLDEMSNGGDTSWMYPAGKRPTGRRDGVTLGFAGTGFKRR
jgi:hypothetical protein